MHSNRKAGDITIFLYVCEYGIRYRVAKVEMTVMAAQDGGNQSLSFTPCTQAERRVELETLKGNAAK